MKVFTVFDREGVDNGGLPQISDIQKICLGISRDVVEAEVNDINSKVGEEVDYEELEASVVCGDEVLTLFDDISLLEELKRRKLIQMEGIKVLIKQMEESIVKKKYEIPAGGISERQVLEVFRLQDAYYAGMNGDEFELSPQEYVIKHWNK